MKKNLIILSAFSFVYLLVWIFWAFIYPEALSFQEQNQMFLFSGDYLIERLCRAGGVAEYIGEFITQFYYYPTLGAIFVAILLGTISVFTFKILKRITLSGTEQSKFLLSLIPAGMLLCHLADPDVLLTYVVAFLLCQLSYLLTQSLALWIKVCMILILYWIAGPLVFVYILLTLWQNPKQVLILAPVGILWIYICRYFWMSQYPWPAVLWGASYFRPTTMILEAPKLQIFIPVVLLLLPGIDRAISFLSIRWKINYTLYALLFIEMIAGIWGYRASYDVNTYALLEQNDLIRRGKWQKVIERAKEYKAEGLSVLYTKISMTSVNLALAMTNQLPDKMFEFPQVGTDGLIAPYIRNNISNISTMEAFWRLGFVNESMRYAFDTQEGILNYQKSGRFTRRMVEANIVNGKYEVASKYIDQLKHTLFYRNWAEHAEKYLYDEDAINNNPEWGHLRQIRLTNDFLYNRGELDKMLGQLYIHNQSNKIAFEYFMAQLLLEGNFQSYVYNLPVKPKEGEDPFPKGYKQFVEFMQKNAGQQKADASTSASSIAR